MSLNNDSDDSDDSLPALSELLPSSKVSCSDDISVGDIVFAKFKKLYWPALVRTLYPKLKKISIWYADDPGKTFKIPLKNVCKFSDTAMRAKITEDVRQAGLIQEHESLTLHACQYLVRKAQGKEDDPMKYFDQTYPYFLVEEMKRKDPNACIADLKIPPLYLCHEKNDIPQKSIRVLKDVCGDLEISTDDDEEMSEYKPDIKDYVKEVNTQISQITDTSIIKYVNDIVQFILYGKADIHLTKVMSKSVSSKYHDLYVEAASCGKKYTNNVTYAGPVEDSAKLKEIINYLLNLYDKKIKNVKTLERISKTTSNFCNKNDEAQYIVSVWLPESIIFAISKIKKVPLWKASCLFTENPKSKTEAIENMLTSLDSLFQDTGNASSSKAVECFVEAEKHTFDPSICSPFKKLCVSKLKAAENNVPDIAKVDCHSYGADAVTSESCGKSPNISRRKISRINKKLDFENIKSQKSDEILENNFECSSTVVENLDKSDKVALNSFAKSVNISPRKLSLRNPKGLNFENGNSPESYETLENKLKCCFTPSKKSNTVSKRRKKF